jgi:VIT1/CCC1 family predicted Fe2+/Mn2+ transporter
MVKQGPIPAFLHSLIEYVAGALLIAGPLLLDYKSGAAKAASIILGVLVLFLVATTTSKLSLINQVPLSMHIVFDYVIAAVMIASPFLFGFSGESTPTAVFIAGGVVWLLLSIGTRYRKEEVPARGEPKRRRGARLPKEGGERGGAAADERPSRVHPSADAVPDDSIPEFEPPPSPRE